ncbi:phage minor head protein [Haloparvum sedimenti]|uniref:phage minor head protein n=1 Tax=Haloparvum sedimenti TaxID=1678448 RepID=UPI00071E68BC|nr:phage minor head protein [Haloparvum sedimenti]
MSSTHAHTYGRQLTAAEYALEESGRVDPTNTTSIQRSLARFLRGRIGHLNSDIRQLLVEEDALGLGDSTGGRWADLSAAETARRFDDWLQRAIQAEVLDPIEARKVRDWFERASKQAARTANGELRRFGVDVDPADDVIQQDAIQDQIDLQQEDTRQRVESWMDDYATDARSLVTAAVGGNVAKSQLMRDISERAQVYKSQVTATASGRVVNQYNTTKLTSYDRVDEAVELDVEAEYQTAGDDKVCDQCRGLAGTYSLEEAQQLVIPDDTHNNCRCQWRVTDVRDVF